MSTEPAPSNQQDIMIVNNDIYSYTKAYVYRVNHLILVYAGTKDVTLSSE